MVEMKTTHTMEVAVDIPSRAIMDSMVRLERRARAGGGLSAGACTGGAWEDDGDDDVCISTSAGLARGLSLWSPPIAAAGVIRLTVVLLCAVHQSSYESLETWSGSFGAHPLPTGEINASDEGRV